MNISSILKEEFKIEDKYVTNIITLIDEGNTIPFIARYRKELTGAMDDQVLREFYERLLYLRNLDERREQVRNTILELELLTDEINNNLNNAKTLSEVEDIYRPFKPKKRTRATIAKERGLEPLAKTLYEQNFNGDLIEEAKKYINEEKEVLTAEDALQGAKDIVAEIISDDPNIRKIIRKIYEKEGLLTSKAVDKEESTVYDMYYEFSEGIKSITGYRILAINRGEKEKKLKVSVDIDKEKVLVRVSNLILKDCHSTKKYMIETIEDSFKRLIEPSIQREIRSELTEFAESGAIKVFGQNLTQLLLQRPIKDKIVLALDPGFRTGCKVAVIDTTGKVLDTGVIYPTPPKSEIEKSKKYIGKLIKEHNVDIIAIGNGTASRETEQFTVDLLKEINSNIQYVIVNEAGASVYSASKLGAKEFPDYDVALRSSVSIGRRLQDPLAELVKIDPKSIGVGQYQHDMNQKKLSEALLGVVESAVNKVGVNLNTASPSLLSYVSGISSSVATNIVTYREEKGKFKERKELLKVSKLGPKAYKQCAGFLKVIDGKNPLDNTSVHPESYDITKKLVEKLGYTLENLESKSINLSNIKINYNELSKELEVGELTLIDIVKELEKPGLDPRDSAEEVVLRSDVLEMEDLKKGMELKGTIRNVIDFGAFVDIGVHQDGLIHISQLSDKFIKHPLDVVSVGDIVNVKVISVDLDKKRIQLTMK